MECFEDVDIAPSKIERRLYYVSVGRNLVSSRSKNEILYLDLECKAITQPTCEIIWIHHLLTETEVEHSSSPINL